MSWGLQHRQNQTELTINSISYFPFVLKVVSEGRLGRKVFICPQWALVACLFQVVCPSVPLSHSHGHSISVTAWWTFCKFGTNIHYSLKDELIRIWWSKVKGHLHKTFFKIAQDFISIQEYKLAHRGFIFYMASSFLLGHWKFHCSLIVIVCDSNSGSVSGKTELKLLIETASGYTNSCTKPSVRGNLHPVGGTTGNIQYCCC